MIPLGSPRGGRKNSDRGESGSIPFLPSAVSPPARFRPPNCSPRLWKMARWVAIVYVVCAVLDSTVRILGFGSSSSGSAGLDGGRNAVSSSLSSWSWTRPRTTAPHDSAYVDNLIKQLPASLANHRSTGHVPATSDPLPWSSAFPQAVVSLQLPHVDRSAFFHLSASELYAKTFGTALQPMEVVPFYLRASGPDGDGFDAADVTITTLATADRWDALVSLVERYRGQCRHPSSKCQFVSQEHVI